MGPLVSILIPVYNTENYLAYCLDSIINQTYNNLQVIIVDDGSIDNSLTIAKKYANKYPFIEVYHQKNSGVATTRNRLLTYIKGDYTLFIDSDDWIEHDTIEFLVNNAVRKNYDIVAYSMVTNTMFPKKSFISEVWNKQKSIKEFLIHTRFRGSLWNKLIKSSLLKGITFDPSISYGEDALFCWNILQNCNSILFTDKQLYHYRMNNESISHQNFGSKKLTGHKVWECICNQTKFLWPQFKAIAYSRWALEDTYLLRAAIQSNYKKDNNILLLQNTIKDNYKYYKAVNFISLKDKLYSLLISRSYWFGKLYFKMHILKKNFR